MLDSPVCERETVRVEDINNVLKKTVSLYDFKKSMVLAFQANLFIAEVDT